MNYPIIITSAGITMDKTKTIWFTKYGSVNGDIGGYWNPRIVISHLYDNKGKI